MEQPGLPELLIFIKKVIKYTRERNYEKLSKYLASIRSYSSQKGNKGVEVEVRKHGGIQAMCICLNRLVEDAKTDSQIFVKHSKVLILCLTLMANAFAVDYVSRKEMIRTDFVQNLHMLLKHELVTFNHELVYRSLKCLGNLLFEVEIRAQAIRIGVIETMFLVMDQVHVHVKFNAAWQRNCNENSSLASSSLPSHPTNIQHVSLKLTVEELSTAEESILLSAIRCVRICAGDDESKHHFCRSLTVGKPEVFEERGLTRVNGILKIGEPLIWPEVESLSEKLQFEILYALTTLTDKLNTATIEIVDDIMRLGGPLLKYVIQTFSTSVNGSKVGLQAIRVLANFAMNKEIAALMLPLGFYEVLFKKIQEANEYTTLDRLLSLFQRFASNGSTICKYLMPYLSVKRSSGHNVCSTLKALRMPKLQKFHLFLLEAYEILSESCLVGLSRAGLLNIIEDIVVQTYGKCSYAEINNTLAHLEAKADTSSCCVHDTKLTPRRCPFAPKNICNSPTYLEVQKEIQLKMEGLNSTSVESVDSVDTGFFQMSPASASSSSPGGRSSSSYDSSFGDGSCSLTVSDDECYSPLSLSLEDESGLLTAAYSEEEEDGDSSLHPSSAKRGHYSPPQTSSPKRGRFSCPDDVQVSFNKSTTDDSSIRIRLDSLPLLRKSGIAVKLLLKLVHIQSIQDKMLEFTPHMLKFCLAAKVSCIAYGQTEDPTPVTEEILSLSKRSFEGALNILTRFFTNIHNFQRFLEDGVISLVYRILMIGNNSMEEEESEATKCNKQLMKFLPALSGHKNETVSWRTDSLRECLRSEQPLLQEKAALAIPILYTHDDFLFRRFRCFNSWDKLFDILAKFDSLPADQFHDCVMSLSQLFTTIRIRWSTEACSVLNIEGIPETGHPNTSDEPKTVLELDDGTRLLVEKKLLVNASPVFSAMLDGHFVETEEQRVKFPHTSRKTLEAFIEQLKLCQHLEPCIYQRTSVVDHHKYDLECMFDLLALSDRFLIRSIYINIANAIVDFYLCPHSAPCIYETTLKMCRLDIWGNSVDERNIQLNYMVTKYIMVGCGLSPSQRTASLRQIFNSVEPAVIIKDLKDLLFYYAEKHEPVSQPGSYFQNKNLWNL